MKETREHILKVAFRLFLQKSFKEVTLKEIVRETSVSKGAFYYYFTSKEKLFLEVIEHYFMGSKLVAIDYAAFSQESLQAFYTEYLDSVSAIFFSLLEEIGAILGSTGSSDADLNTLNYYLMAFDALKMFPPFRLRMEEYSKLEIVAWTGAVARARAGGEINSPLSDEEIANLFLYASDGLGMRLIMSGRVAELRNMLKHQWDNLYRLITDPHLTTPLQ